MIALVAVGVALGIPPTPPAAAPAGRSGPASVGDEWPGARILDIPSVLPDGSTFEPWLVTGAATAVGIARSTSGTDSRLVLQAARSAPVVLQNLGGADPPILAAVAYADSQIFWLRIDAPVSRASRTSVWRYRIGETVPQQIASDPGEPDYNRSQYDLEVNDGRLSWTTQRPDNSTDIRSASTDGGAVRVETLAGSYQLTTPPWAVRSSTRNLGTQAGGRGADVDLLNLVTRAHMTAKAAPDQILSCTPVWCRVTSDQGGRSVHYVEHPDGSAPRRIGTGALVPVVTDVALLDRFEVLGEPNAIAGGFGRLWLYDLSDDHMVLLDDKGTDSVQGRDGYVWWAGSGPGDDWHVLDLRQLS
jgi:hypothetical protein